MEPPRMNAALIIANNIYRHWPSLRTCHDEADILAETIKDFGREGSSEDVALWVAKDADHDEMQGVIEKFLCKAKQGGVNLLFFAGHGVETGQGTFLLPTDAPEMEDGYMDLDRATSVEGLKYQFSAKDRRSNLAIVLACCREPVQAKKIKRPSLKSRASAVAVLHACEPGHGVADAASPTMKVKQAEEELVRVNRLGAGLARALTIMRLAHRFLGIPVLLMPVLQLAQGLAYYSNYGPGGKVRGKEHPILSTPATMQHIYKRPARNAVPDAAVRPTIMDMKEAWKSDPRVQLDPCFRRVVLFVWEHGHDDLRITKKLRRLLGDRWVSSCLPCFSKEPLTTALEIYCCSQLMYRFQRLASTSLSKAHYMKMADDYMQRALGLFLNADLDEYVQATFFVCFALYLSHCSSSIPEDSRCRKDAWDFMLLASEYHGYCGLTELSACNMLEACSSRLRLESCSPASAEFVEQSLRGMSSKLQRELTDRRVAHRLALIIRARILQHKWVETQTLVDLLFDAIELCPKFVQDEIANLLPEVKQTSSAASLALHTYSARAAPINGLREALCKIDELLKKLE
ncbi:unnamed protein product [Symbiodinium sp. CCMP2592]|nr:unnamed protein product [Symbiodinium sp. CCMP2592]